MLAFFRRVLSSWLAVALLGVILIAFIVTGVGTPGGGFSGGPGANAVATVGGRPVTVPQVAQRVQGLYREAQRQQPGLAMPAFLAAIGGLAGVVEQYVDATVLGVWAEKHGITANERLIGAEIAAVPAFQGPTGQFDQRVMDAALGQQRMTFASLHDGIRDDLVRRQLLLPVTAAAALPDGLVKPYAALLIQRREGAVGIVSAKADGVPAPDDAAIANWYKDHLARYSLPERRVVRYAPVGPEAVHPAPPSDAEVAAAYRADAAKYVARETRRLDQVVLPTQAAADALAAKVKGGTAFAKAAADAGFAAADIALGDVDRASLARSASPAVADAAFALPANGTTAPIKTPLGFAIVHVDRVTAIPARSLAEATPEIRAAFARKRADDALGTLVQAMQDQLSDGASFNDVAKKHGLAAVTTPPLLPNGTAPTDPAFKADAVLTALMRAAAQAGADDPATIETIDPTHFALLGVAQVVPAAPMPLAEVRDRVRADIVAQVAADRARAQAQALAARVKAGQPLAAALAAAGLPPAQPLGSTQVELARAGGNVPVPMRALFRLTAGGTEVAPGPGGVWYVVHLDRIVPGSPASLAPIVNAAQTELSRSLGDEYAQQLVNAARATTPVRRNPSAVAALDAQLRGRSPQGE